MDQYIGAEDGVIVFFGEKVDVTIGQLLPPEALLMEPVIYYRANNQNASVQDIFLVWKIENGYMTIKTYGSSYNRSIYEERASSICYVSDLSYLNYVE